MGGKEKHGLAHVSEGLLALSVPVKELGEATVQMSWL